jgi:large subunit ribosomal protein L30
MTRKIWVTQVKSGIDRESSQKRTLRALGLGRLHRRVVFVDGPQVRGMLRKVEHLVRIEEGS